MHVWLLTCYWSSWAVPASLGEASILLILARHGRNTWPLFVLPIIMTSDHCLNSYDLRPRWIEGCPGPANVCDRRSSHSSRNLLSLLYPSTSDSYRTHFRRPRCPPNRRNPGSIFPKAGRTALSRRYSMPSHWPTTPSFTRVPWPPLRRDLRYAGVLNADLFA